MLRQLIIVAHFSISCSMAFAEFTFFSNNFQRVGHKSTMPDAKRPKEALPFSPTTAGFVSIASSTNPSITSSNIVEMNSLREWSPSAW